MTQCHGVITLLPKKERDPHFIKHYRPMTLLNTDYKIIATVMANHDSNQFYMKLGHNDQTGFMKVRTISRNYQINY